MVGYIETRGLVTIVEGQSGFLFFEYDSILNTFELVSVVQVPQTGKAKIHRLSDLQFLVSKDLSVKTFHVKTIRLCLYH